jgi:hypothetical protein
MFRQEGVGAPSTLEKADYRGAERHKISAEEPVPSLNNRRIHGRGILAAGLPIMSLIDSFQIRRFYFHFE